MIDQKQPKTIITKKLKVKRNTLVKFINEMKIYQGVKNIDEMFKPK